MHAAVIYSVLSGVIMAGLMAASQGPVTASAAINCHDRQPAIDTFRALQPLLHDDQSIVPGRTSYLSRGELSVLAEEVLERVGCERVSPTACSGVSTVSLFRLVGGNLSLGLDEAQFLKAAPILLFYAHDLREALEMNLTAANAAAFTDWLVMGKTPGMEEEGHEDEGEGESHDHEEDHAHEDDDDHDHNETEEDHGHEEDDEDHEDDHDHDHDHDNTAGSKKGFHNRLQRILQQIRKTYTMLDIREESHNASHADLHDDSHDEGTEVKSHTESHDDSHEGESHDHTEDESCFDAYILRRDAAMETKYTATAAEAQRVAAAALLYMLKGYNIKTHCVNLPYKEEFVENTFSRLGVTGDGLMSLRAFNKLLASLKLGGMDSHETTDTSMDSHGHDHGRKKRSTTASTTATTTSSDALGKCMEGSEILTVFGINSTLGLTRNQFAELCPALISQQITAACDHQPTTPTATAYSTAAVYGYGFLSVIIISLCALFGLLLVPCMNTAIYRDVMAIFIGLAVGSLTGDAILHLLPAGFGLHEHGGDEHDHGHGGVMLEDYTKKGLGIIAAIYGFYIIESIMEMLQSRDPSDIEGRHHSHMPDLPLNPVSKDSSVSKEGLTNGTSMDSVSRTEAQMNTKDTDVKQTRCCRMNIRPVVWMITVGDGIHNFADGLAIGAAFTVGLRDGLATSIAVFCHELPHELGDFAVLLNAGLSYKVAASVNFLSALTAVVGMFVGVSISENDEISSWIFVIASGMFLYVALVEMVPELVKMLATESNGCKRLRYFFLQNLGILIGVMLMVIIALYEEDIKI